MRAKIIPPSGSLFLPFQEKWLYDTSRLKIAEKSRQIGWTWTTAASLVDRKCHRRSRLDSWISSRDELQAELFLEDCKSFAHRYHIAATDLGASVVDDHGHSAYVVALANGLRIHSMSSSPNAHAGKRGDRILDEFALHSDPKQLYAIAYPGITWGGSLEIFSTHRGSHNYFNELIQEIKAGGNPKGFSRHSVTLEHALDQGLLYKLQEKLPPDDPRQEMDEADYFNFIKFSIDQTGIGRQFTERAQARYGKFKVEGVHFTSQTKEELAYPVRVAFESRVLRIPEDQLIRADLRAVRKETTSSGNLRFASERNSRGHSDRFWALALALYATSKYVSCSAMVVIDH